MANCYECLHYEACSDVGDAGFSYLKDGEEKCDHFKNKADFVEVVRCKDCEYCSDLIMSGLWCEHPDNIMPLGSNPTDFCSYGERREK